MIHEDGPRPGADRSTPQQFGVSAKRRRANYVVTRALHEIPYTDVMTRRDLAKLAAGVATSPQVRLPGAVKYTGALDGADTKIDPKNFDPVLFSQHFYEMSIQARKRR